MTAIAKLKAMLGLDSKEFEAGTKRASGAANALQATMSRIGGVLAGAFSVGAIVAFGRSVQNTAVQIKDLADNLNVSVGDIGALSVRAAETGTSLETVGNILAKLQTKQMEVAKGNEETIKSFKALGISADQVIDADVVQLFELVAIGADKSSLAVADLGELLEGKLGKKTLDIMREVAKNGIGSISDETVKAIEKTDELNNKWNTFKQNFKLKALEFVVNLVDPPKQRRQREAQAKRDTESRRSPFEIKLDEEKFLPQLFKFLPNALEGKKPTEVSDASKALREIQAREKSKKIQEEIDRLRGEMETVKGKGGNLSQSSFSQDSLRDVGGLIGRDLPMMPILERQLRASEKIAELSTQMRDLQQQQLYVMQNKGYE